MATTEANNQTNTPPAGSLDAGIAAFTAAQKTDTPAPPETAQAQPTATEAQQTTAPTETAETKPEDAPAEPPKPAAAPDPMSAVARKEKELRAERAAWKAEQDKATAATAEREARLAEREAKLSGFEADPMGFLEAHGIGKEKWPDLAKVLWHATLGDKAPPDFKAQVDAIRRSKEVDAKLAEERKAREKLEADLKSRDEADKARAHQEQVAQVRATYDKGFEAAIQALPEDSFARAELESDRTGLLESLWTAAIAEAQKRQVEGGDDAKDPDPAELVQAYEAAVSKKFGRIKTKTAEPENAEKTASAKNLSAAKAASPTTKRPAAVSEDERLKRGIEAFSTVRG